MGLGPRKDFTYFVATLTEFIVQNVLPSNYVYVSRSRQDGDSETVSTSYQCLLKPQLMVTVTDWIISHSPLVFLVSC